MLEAACERAQSVRLDQVFFGLDAVNFQHYVEGWQCSMRWQRSAPLPLAAEHLSSDSESGEPSLDEWQKRRALNKQLSGATWISVVVD